MRQIVKSLRVRPDNGHLTRKSDRYTSSLFRPSEGEYMPVSDEFVIEAALKILAGRIVKGAPLTSPREVRSYLRLRLGDLHHEVFCLLFLDKRHRLIAWEELFRGTIDGASVHPREVVKKALGYNAAAVILYHYVARNRMRVICPRSFCVPRRQ